MGKFFFILLFFLGVYCPRSKIVAQSPTLKFETINEKQNLSHNSVTGIAQDDQGFIWITTISGLNRFDGYECKVFKHIPKDTNSISGNRTGGICFDGRGCLWVGTVGFGLNRFNPKTEIFKHYFHSESDSNSISSNFISGIIEDKRGYLWIGTKYGLNILKPGGDKFVHYFHDPDNSSSIAGNEISAPYEDSKGNIWITTIDGGLSKYDFNTDSFINYTHNPQNPGSISTNNLNAIREDKYGSLWIATYQGGLEKFDPAKNVFTHFRYSPENKQSLSNDIVYSIYIDKFNNVWAGTRNGISILNTSTGLFANYISYPNMKHSLSNNNIDKFFEDRDGNIWITTYGGGVSRVLSSQNRFIVFRNDPKDENSLSNNFVTALIEYNDIIYVGTVSGLNIFDRKRNKWNLLAHIPGKKNSLDRDEIGALFCDSGDLWVGTRGSGINIFNIKTFEKKQVYNKKKKLPGNDIIRLYKDPSGKIWILTAESGFCSFDLKSKIFEYYNEDNASVRYPLRPRAILSDMSNNLWIGTYKDGLYLYDKKGRLRSQFVNEPDNPNSLGNNTVWDIFEESGGKIWVCTDGGGINLYNPEQNNFVRFTTADGLPNDVVYAAEEDRNNFLWISTNNGASRFDPGKKEFKNFTVSDGLQGSEFNSGVSFKNKKGELLFGGINGFNLFDPAKFKLNIIPPEIVFTSFKIENREADFDTSIAYIKNVKLSYNDKVFTIKFAGLDYGNRKKVQYSYILEGFSKGWTNPDVKRTATYTNLNPGKYIFEVKASSGDGYWSREPAALLVTIAPPFWGEWWFKIIIGVILLSAIIGTVRYFSTKKLKRQVLILEKEKAVQEERERISRDLHDNIGSQLTFLISSLDNLSYGQKKIEIKEKLNKLGEFGRQTLNELRNTIWAMKHKETDLKNFVLKVKELKMNLTEHLDTLEVNVIDSTTETVKLNSVQNLNLFRIIEESLQNAIKYSGADRYSVEFITTTAGFIMRIKDNGSGFDKEKVETGDGLHNMKYRCEEAGGKFSINAGSNGVEIICEFKI